MQEKLLREATSQCVAALEVLRSVIPTSESRSLIRDVFAGFLLLRWADLQDAEQEAIAAFEDRTYQPLLPEPLQWRHWVRLDHPRPIADRLQELAQYVDGLRGDAAHPVAFYLHALAEPLRRVLKVNFVYLHDFIRWVADVPFETLSERRSLLEVFDQVIVETGDLYEGVGHYATPENVARLVAALANPQPGERVYDPCFGSGNLLVAAWQQAERSRHELLRPGALLEVAGIEIDASSFLVGLTRMLLEGIEAPLLELGNSLERESLSSPCRQGFDVVMANPPIGVRINRDHRLSRQFPIASNDSANLFVQHVLSQLKPQGRAVLAVPEGLLFRGGAERELRRNLLEQGVIEGVIKLPDGVLAPYTSVKVHLLLLRKQGGISRVRITDACGMFERVPGRKQPFISVGAIESVVRAFNRPQLLNPDGLPSDYDRYLAGAPWTATWELGIEELAAIDWDLSPRRREKGGLSELLADITGIHGIHGIHGKFAPIAA
ncbi:MAG: N-6 DNA methylase, partial [Rhodoferax sp.]|nr:N-6 DNA methylase [Rhodoferax sp.]